MPAATCSVNINEAHTFIAFTSFLFWFIQTFVKPPGKLTTTTVYVHSPFACVYYTSGYKGLPRPTACMSLELQQ